MPSHCHGPTLVVEPTYSRTFDYRSPQPGDASDQVDDSGSGKIDDSGSEQEVVGSTRAGPAVGGPEPVSDDGINEAGEEQGVDQIGDELSPFGDRAACYSGSGNRESPLVEEESVVERGRRKGT